MSSCSPSPAQAARELLLRRRAAAKLIDFTAYTTEGRYQAARHHFLIAEALEAVERGEIDRLMVFMPPRHGKSELASRRFPAWYLGRNPSRQIISASYSSDLSGDFGREVRNIVAADRYQKVFPGVSLRPDSKAAYRWHTSGDGVYVSAGVGTSVTGRGADVALIDDPFKDRQEADSETRREHVWRWYQSTLYTRLMPGAAIILIQTRWHEDDLAGRLLEMQAKGQGDRWTVLELPALNEAGEALWPEWYPAEALHRIRAAVGPREWSALYQQRPQPDEGAFFQRNWVGWYDEAPKHLNIYITGDFAITERDGADFTELGVWGTDHADNLYALDWWYGQATADRWVDALADLIIKWRPHCFFGEAGMIRRAIEPFLVKRLAERRAYCRREWIPPVSDKPSRARGFQARLSMGKVLLPRRFEWAQRLLTQLLAFPAGKHDDAVDVCSLMGLVLDQAHPAVLPPPADTRSAFDKRLDELYRSGGQDPWLRQLQTETISPWDHALYGDSDHAYNDDPHV